MSNATLAQIRWLPPESGGRETLPAAGRYATVAQFDTNPRENLEPIWSIVINLAQPAQIGKDSVATVSFLVPYAPEAFLRPGNQFMVLEGKRIVAHGEVLS